MQTIISKLFIIFGVMSYVMTVNAMEVVGYTYRGDSILHLINDDIVQQNTSLTEHIQKINVISPQAYQINERGTVWGAIDPIVERLAIKHHVKLMPLVTNADFDSARTHKFLIDMTAQQLAIKQLVAIAKAKHFYGVQIDFEHILMVDKDRYSDFIKRTASAFHTNQLALSVAIFPKVSDKTAATDRARSALEYWSGGYDYKSLGASADFLSLMAYAQHGGGTTPGSACEPAWVEKIIRYAVDYVPANKLSIGLPVYSAYWYTATHHAYEGVKETDVTYAQLSYLIDKFQIKKHWDDSKKLSYAVFVNNDLNEFIYAEDKKAFAVKLDLIQKYHLRGVSLWHLGAEDPDIWALI
jgi:spore germination protein